MKSRNTISQYIKHKTQNTYLRFLSMASIKLIKTDSKIMYPKQNYNLLTSNAYSQKIS